MKRLIIIDPQNSFMDAFGDDKQRGSLGVDGASADMDRLARWIDQEGSHLDAIDVTLDWHEEMDIAHVAWYQKQDGSALEPFSLVTSDDLESGRVRCVDMEQFDATLAYVKALESKQIEHRIWPLHCIKDSRGAQVYDPLQKSLSQWELTTGRTVNYIFKGENPLTEHFSGFKAQVPRLDDPKTNMNWDWIEDISKDDVVFFAGEAFTHCLGQSVLDCAHGLLEKQKNVPLFVLSDTTSCVYGYDKGPMENQLKSVGVQFVTTENMHFYSKSMKI